MPVSWLLPAALTGLVLTAIPIAIHLLVRQRSRQVSFPSLRFLEQSQIAALRRRSIDDRWLLAVRVLIVTSAVLALAAPVFQGTWRSASQAARVARAVVIEAGNLDRLRHGYGEFAFATATFSRERLADAIVEAVVWLNGQPPSARELVVAASFKVGQLSQADLAAVPPAVGITLDRLGAAGSPRDIDLSILRLKSETLVRTEAAVHLAPGTTTVTEGADRTMPSWPIRVVAADADQALADAALRAVLDAGVRWPFAEGEQLVVVWTGADDSTIQQAKAAGATVITMEAPRGEREAPSALHQALARTLPALDVREPERIPDKRLAEWSRPAGPPPADAPMQDEGDRRWLWAAALLLIGVEHLLRRRRFSAVVESSREARVA